MSKRIPIARARELGQKYEYDGLVIIGLNEDGNHWITTYGRTKKLCGDTARAAHRMMDLWNHGPDCDAYQQLREYERKTRSEKHEAKNTKRITSEP